MPKSETIMSFCPHCGNRIRIDQVHTPGKGDQQGGWILECVSCRKPFHKYLGNDIKLSSIIGGALVLATYEDHVPGNRIDTLKRFGIFEDQKGGRPAKQIARKHRRKPTLSTTVA